MAVKISKIPTVLLIGIILLLGGILAFYVVCDRPSKNEQIAKWKGAYEEQLAVTQADHAISDKIIADIKKQNAELQGHIDSAYTVISSLEASKEKAEADLTAARQGWGAFTIEAQAALTNLDNAWAKKFSILEDQGKQKDAIIIDLTKQRDFETAAKLEYKSKFEREERLRLSCEKGIGLQDKKIASLERQTKFWKGVALISNGAWAGLTLLKK
ncbi:MAG: hypothetical protein WC455_22905 [Dehalococcoidia bacterium]|jgi:hypothetical protein